MKWNAISVMRGSSALNILAKVCPGRRRLGQGRSAALGDAPAASAGLGSAIHCGGRRWDGPSVRSQPGAARDRAAAAAAARPQVCRSEWGRKLYAKTLIRQIGLSLYKDCAELERSLRTQKGPGGQPSPFHNTPAGGFEYGFKIRVGGRWLLAAQPAGGTRLHVGSPPFWC
jgi:hypothetical protein